MADTTAAELRIIISAEIAKAQEQLRQVGDDAQKMAEEMRVSGSASKEAVDGLKHSIQELKVDMADLKDKVLSVHLDDAQAKAGFDELKADAASLHNEKIKVKVDIAEAKTHFDELMAREAEIRSAVSNIDVKDKRAEFRLRGFKLELERIRNAFATIHLDDANAMRKLNSLNARLDETQLKIDKLRSGTGGGGGGILGGLIASVLPSASPLAAAGVGGGMALASAGAPGLIGTGGLAAVSIANLKPIFAAVSQYKKDMQAAMTATSPAQYQSDIVKAEMSLNGLTTAQKQAVQALSSFESTWQNFATAFQKPVFNLFEQALKSIETLMTDMKPVISASAGAFTTLFSEMNKGLNSSDNKQFFQWLAKTAGPSITAFGHVTANVFRGIANLLMAFSPAAKSMEQGLVHLTSDFYKWTDSLAGTKGFHEFINYVKSSGPQVTHLIGQLADLLGNVLKAMAPLGPPILKVVTGTAKLANDLLQLNPLVSTFAALALQSWGISKLLGPFGNMGKAVTDFIPKIGEMAGKGGLVGKLGKSLTGLIPGFKAVGSGLSFIGGPWGILIGAVGVGVLEIVTHWKQITTWVKKNFGIDIPADMRKLENVFKQVWNAIRSAVQVAINYIKPTILNAVKAIEIYWKQVWPQIQKVFQEVWNLIKPILKVVFTVWKTELDAFFGFVKGAWKPFWAAIGDVLKAYWDLMKGTLKTAWDAISGLFKVFLDILTGKWGKAWDDLKSTLTNVWKDIKGMFTSFLADAEDFGKNIVTSIVDGIKGAISGAEKDLWSVWNGFKSFFGFGGSSPSASLGPNVQSIQPSTTATSWPASTVPSTGGSPIYNTTIHVSGNVTKNEQELANKVASAQMAAMKRTTKVG